MKGTDEMKEEEGQLDEKDMRIISNRKKEQGKEMNVLNEGKEEMSRRRIKRTDEMKADEGELKEKVAKESKETKTKNRERE